MVLVAAAVLLAVDVASSWVGVYWCSGPLGPGRDHRFVTLRLGRVGGGWVSPMSEVVGIDGSRRGWGVYRPSVPRLWLKLLVDDATGFRVYLPLWIPTVLCGLTGAVLWWRGRAPPRGHCPQCWYDLRTVMGSVCPECGRARDA